MTHDHSPDTIDDGPMPGPERLEPPPPRSRLAAGWNALTAAIATLMGLLPHLLHHVGIFAGAALVTGVGGNLAFGALGLLLSLPLLRRLYRRFRTWKAPAAAVAVFTVMFSLSAFVIGPALTTDGPSEDGVPTRTPTPEDHGDHHPGGQ
jgi:hypothetical protein